MVHIGLPHVTWKRNESIRIGRINQLSYHHWHQQLLQQKHPTTSPRNGNIPPQHPHGPMRLVGRVVHRHHYQRHRNATKNHIVKMRSSTWPASKPWLYRRPGPISSVAMEILWYNTEHKWFKRYVGITLSFLFGRSIRISPFFRVEKISSNLACLLLLFRSNHSWMNRECQRRTFVSLHWMVSIVNHWKNYSIATNVTTIIWQMIHSIGLLYSLKRNVSLTTVCTTVLWTWVVPVRWMNIQPTGRCHHHPQGQKFECERKHYRTKSVQHPPDTFRCHWAIIHITRSSFHLECDEAFIFITTLSHKKETKAFMH